jgi:zinc protease
MRSTRLYLFLTIGLLAAFLASAQEPAPQPEPGLELSTVLPVEDAIVKGQLDNGLTYLIRTNQKPENRAELWLVVNAGSIQEDDDQQGLAHFVEHMAFNGTRNFAKQELVNYLESIGMTFGPDINAFTSFDETVYNLTIPTDDAETVATAFQILEDWAHGLAFEGEEIDKERGVVVEEWRLGRGAEARIRDKQFPVLFEGSRYADRLPIGKVEILESAPHEALRRFYRDWYRPDLMAVIAVGDFDPESIQELIRQHFSGLEMPAEVRPREAFSVPDHQGDLFAITTDPEATMTSIGVYSKMPKQSRGTVGDYREQVVEQLYHGMVNARLSELTQEADPPFLYGVSASAGIVRSRDFYIQAAGVREGQVIRGLEALLTEAERADRHGFTRTELDRLKADLLRAYEQAYAERDKRESGSLAAEYMRHFLEEEPIPGIEMELEIVREFLPTISLEELNELADVAVQQSNRVVLLSGPEKADQPLPDEEALAAAFESVASRDVAAFVDRTRDTPLLEIKPTASPVVEERFIEEIGVTEWRLENGIRVVLKPTDFKNDQVLLTGFSPGGHSLVPNAKYNSATFADTILSEGGVGEFDAIELEKSMPGKLVSVSPFISELEEGVSASASPQDLETLFQLIYLSVTAPRADPDAYQAFMTKMESFIENRESRPELAFSDEVQTVTYGGHLRRRPISIEVLQDIDLATALEVFQDRFADTSDFTFLIVGNFELASIRPLVESYLGGLPTTGREETWRDIGADPVEGKLEVTMHRGLEPKSRVQLLLRGPAEWSRENLHDLQSLAAALRIRLREVLREDMGATYGVGVNGILVDRPKERYLFAIGFGCAPENVEEMIAAVKKELQIVQEAGLDETYAEKVQEAQRRRREVSLKENGFWISVLRTYYTRGMDPRLAMDYDALLARVTPENFKATAKKYLSSANTMQATLFPEAPTEPAEEETAGKE